MKCLSIRNFSSSEYFSSSIVDINWLETRNIVILSILFFLSRLPLLNLGFGLDSDAWRVANSAFDLYFNHIYHVSRFPGYPLHELINSLVINYGWIATNSLTVIVSFISVIAFARLLNLLGEKNKGLLVLGYVFLPILWINSANTMDYMWGLAFILLSWLFIIKKRYIYAGLFISFAIGTRITNAVFIIPFLYFIWSNDRNLQNIYKFLLTVSLLSIVLYSPLFFKYGISFFKYYPGKLALYIIFARLIGEFGVLTLLFGLALLPLCLRKIISGSVNNFENKFLLTSIFLIFVIFIFVPHEPEYLIPAIPFGLILLNRLVSKRLIITFLIISLSYSVISVNFNPLNITHSFDISRGEICENIVKRKDTIRFVRKIMNAKVDEQSVIIVGWYLPYITYLHKTDGKNNKNINYKNIVVLKKIKDLQSKNKKIYYVKGMKEYTKRTYGYSLDDYDCIYLSP